MMTKLLLLTTLLSMNNAEIIKNVQLAVENPTEYAKNFDEMLFERGEPSVNYPGFAWLAMIDQLMANDRWLADELDVKTEKADTLWSIEKVLKAHHFDEAMPLLKNLEVTNVEDPQELLMLVGEALQKHKIALIGIWIDSDSYVYSVLPLEEWQKISNQFAAKRAYGGVVLFQKNMALTF